MMYINQRSKQRGVTALFIVIFSVLLMSTITMSFMTLMIREQQRATNNELSQSAYDSAMAGVEDAKRVIAKTYGADAAVAQAAQEALDRSLQPDGCLAIGKNANGITSGVDEIPIQSSTTTGQELNQAYTCVQVQEDTDSYEGSIAPEHLMMIPLKMTDAIDRVRISWQRANENGSETFNTLTDPVTTPLLSTEAWDSENHPAMMRAQTITPDASFELSDFDDAETNSAVFLYPNELIGDPVQMPDNREEQVSAPELALCDTDVVIPTQFVCSAMLELAQPVPGGSEISYLVLKPLYRGAEFRVEAYMGDTLVTFDGVQPIVDSTGRANDLFRRVEARLGLGGYGEQGTSNIGPIPYYALDVGGSLCKHFYVTDDSSGAYTPGCTP